LSTDSLPFEGDPLKPKINEKFEENDNNTRLLKITAAQIHWKELSNLFPIRNARLIWSQKRAACQEVQLFVEQRQSKLAVHLIVWAAKNLQYL
jgi:hypothetical protein